MAFFNWRKKRLLVRVGSSSDLYMLGAAHEWCEGQALKKNKAATWLG